VKQVNRWTNANLERLFARAPASTARRQATRLLQPIEDAAQESTRRRRIDALVRALPPTARPDDPR
jgi:hypothetical protein